MNPDMLTPRLRHQLAIPADAGYMPPTGARVLDLGCGEGNSVRALRAAGYDALGCEVELWDSPQARELVDAGLVRQIPMQPYRLPFDDGMFDIALSDEVFEHVRNYSETLAELHRVMKPSSVSLHLFPARWIPIEPHVHVPLASVIRSYPWLLLWAALGVRNAYQRGKSAREVAELNRHYLTSFTNYLNKAEIRRHFSSQFPVVRFAEDLFLKHSKRGEIVYRLSRWLPFLVPLYSACWNRVVLAAKG